MSNEGGSDKEVNIKQVAEEQENYVNEEHYDSRRQKDGPKRKSDLRPGKKRTTEKLIEISEEEDYPSEISVMTDKEFE